MTLWHFLGIIVLIEAVVLIYLQWKEDKKYKEEKEEFMKRWSINGNPK